MHFDYTKRRLVETIIRTEDLQLKVSENFEDALGDTVFKVTGNKEQMAILRDVYMMANI